MDNSSLRRPLWALAGVLSLTLSGLAAAEPPSRAARLGFVGGTVSFSPAGQRDWVHAAVNRPLTTGDRLWTSGSSRAELQIGGAAIRMGPSTSMVLLNLDDRITQVQLSQGSLRIRVRSLGPRQTFEVATPNLAFTLRRAGDYRIEVDPNDDATIVRVERGHAEVYGEGASYTVTSNRAYRFYGTDLSDYDTVTARRDDDLDRWSRERDRRGDRSVSARYVSSEVVGYEDLDANGSWRNDATYGNVWTPHRVASGWTPYRDGHWSWVDPWGWTWVDDAPWGYAVSHYGRWANINGAWAWVPGPQRERAVYAPALVAFVGGTHFHGSVSGGSAPASSVGWFPLAPREVYQPSYPVSRGYFDNINRSNAVIAPAAMAKVYNTTIVNNNTTVVNNTTNVTNIIYANQTVTGAVVAVPAQAFVQSQPVAKAVVQLPREAVASAPVVRVAAVAPVQQSVQGGAREAVAKPPVQERVVVARTAPPPAAVPFVAQQAQLDAKPGAPIDAAQRTQLKPAAPAVAAPKVVVAAAPTPTPTALPPATAPGAKSPEARKAAVAAKPDAPIAEGRKPDADKAAAAIAEAAKVKAAAAAADAAKVTSAKAEALKAEAAKVEAAKVEAAKVEAAKAAAAKAATANAEAAAKAAATKADATKAADAKAAEAKADAIKASNAKVEAGKADQAKAEKARAETAKADAAKAEGLRTDAAKAAMARAEAVKADAAKADASKAEAAKAAAERAEASKVAATKAEEAKAAQAKLAEAKADAAQAAIAKAEASKKADEARAERSRGDAARAEASKAEAMKADAARADAAKAATAKAESAKAEAAKAEAARADAAKVAAARAETARADAARADAAKAVAAKAEAQKAEAIKAAAAAALAKAPPGAVAPPKARASGPKPDADSNPDDEKKKEGRKP